MEIFYSLCLGALVKLSPLLFCSLAVTLAFRGGLWNIGAEGQLIVGAIAATVLATQPWSLSGWLWTPLVLTGAVCAGAFWGGIAGFLKVTRNVPEVITTILLNFIAIELLSYCVHGPLQESAQTYPMSDTIHMNLELPVLGQDEVIHIGIVLALLFSFATYLFMFHTANGFKVRAMGQNDRAVDVAGFSLKKIRFFLFMASGAFAGFGGAIELLGVSHRLFERFSPGYGFAAIAIALLGRLHPLWIIVSSLLFAFVYAGAGILERVAGIPSTTLYIAQAVVIFIVLIIGIKKNRVSYGH